MSRQSKKDEMLDALNRLDELASLSTGDNNIIEELGIGEAERQERDYNSLFDYISGSQMRSIRIPLSTNDLEELLGGEEFVWSFEDQNGESIETILYKNDFEEDN